MWLILVITGKRLSHEMSKRSADGDVSEQTRKSLKFDDGDKHLHEARHHLQKHKKFPVGNYDAYRGKRCARSTDSRLHVLPKEIFERKRVLDIGCNAGELTIAIAMKFHTKSMHGIDVDHRLITQARHNLKSALAATTAEDLTPVTLDSLPLSFRLQQATPTETKHDISFVVDDIVEKCVNIPSESFDTVTCFSVSKWIHLNHGDEGLQQVFRNVHRILVPGGKFVLEPQQWESYRKRRDMNEVYSS